MSQTRRDKKRQQVYEEIQAVAHDLMREQGTNGISIRGITRAMGLSATALYRYYESLDALITDLLLDAFNGLANAVEDATIQDAPAPLRFLGGLRAYRAWAIANPVKFELIYGNPIPNYEAPADVTVPASARTLRLLTLALVDAIHAGDYTPMAHYSTPAGIEAHLNQILQQSEGDSLTQNELAHVQQALYITLHCWSRVHGIVMLEIFGHLPPTVGDMATFFRHYLMALAVEIGMEGITMHDLFGDERMA